MSNLPEVIVNGADQNYKKNVQTWERPWTLEEIRQTSVNWSLGADSGLFLCLQDFSQRMLAKTHDIEKQLDGLILDTKTTECCLHTVFNDFLMLSNTQFIENRVYDEEVEDPVSKTGVLEKQPEQKEKTREQKEAALIPKMLEAVNYGLKTLDSAFEQLDIKAGNSDSEDDEVTDRVEQILEPKDLYVDRPLPHLIGSQLFMEQDDVGLGDLSSEEITMDSDRDSILDSEDGKEAEFNEDLSQDEEMQDSVKKLSMGTNEDDEDGDSDIFGESDKYYDDEDKGKTDPSFAEELASRIRSELVSQPEEDHTLVENKDELFISPKIEDDFSLFGGKGLFSGGRGLFDDDEGDLFSDAPRHPLHEETTVVISQISEPPQPTQTTSGGVSTLSEGGPERKPGEQSVDDFVGSSGLLQTKYRNSGSIFRDDEDDENVDLFSEKYRDSSVINEEPAEPIKSLEKKMPAGAISMFGPGTKNLLNECLRKQLPRTSDKSEKSEGCPPPLTMKGSENKAEKAPTQNLIPEEDSQMLPTVSKGQCKTEPRTERKHSKSALSLFDEDEEDEDLFAPKSKAEPSQFKKTASGSLFSDDEDQWINPKQFVGKPVKNIVDVTSGLSAPSGLPSVNTPHQDSLFDEDGVDDDLFATTKIFSQKKHHRVAPLFEDEDNSKLFGIQPAAKTMALSIKPTEPPATAAEDKPPEQRRPSFQDEELFSHIQQIDDIPEVDLFAPFKTADATTISHKANLVSKPATLAVSPKTPGVLNVFPNQLEVPGPSLATGSVIKILGIQTALEEGINFDKPAHVITLHSASKGRAKGSERRRPQTRAARLQSAQNSMVQREVEEITQEEKPSTNTQYSLTGPDQTSLNIVPLPTLPSPDPFGFDSVFGCSPAVKWSIPFSSSKTNFDTKVDNFSSDGIMQKREQQIQTTPSLFEEHGDDLFERVKPRVVKEAVTSSFLEEDAKEELFPSGKNSLAAVFTKDTMTISSFPKEDVLQEKWDTVHKGNTNLTETSSLDIFADLIATSRSKPKKKVEPKSIFDDDMDDIFSSSPVRLGTSATQNLHKTQTSQVSSEPEDSCRDIFNDPLNVLGGN